MAKVKTTEQPIAPGCSKKIEELRSYKYLLGEFGIAMLTAISRGATDPDSIMMLSGVPSACITGRMPILLNLSLVVSSESDIYQITEMGKQFLECIKNCD